MLADAAPSALLALAVAAAVLAYAGPSALLAVGTALVMLTERRCRRSSGHREDRCHSESAHARSRWTLRRVLDHEHRVIHGRSCRGLPACSAALAATRRFVAVHTTHNQDSRCRPRIVGREVHVVLARGLQTAELGEQVEGCIGVDVAIWHDESLNGADDRLNASMSF